MSRLRLALAGACLASAGLIAPASAAMPRTVADFDGDGYGDLAIGAPGAFAGQRAGGVVVLYGTASGLRTGSAQRWTQDSPGIAGTAEDGDGFGAAVAVGDFDGDGYSDLAVGVPDEDSASTEDGVVHVLYGSPAGLTATGSQLWSPDAAGVPGTALYNRRFGAALAAGDLDGDGRADLSVGAPGGESSEMNPTPERRGAVWVFPGGSNGLRPGPWLDDPAQQPGGRFGSALATGDFDGDRRADLAVGAPEAKVRDPYVAGRVWIYPGSATGPAATRRTPFDQDTPGVVGTPESGDGFGWALAAGDFDNDGRDDLAAGAPFEDVGGARDGGAVSVLRGSTGGLTGSRSQLWHPDVPGVPGVAEQDDGEYPQEDDFFGWALATADFDRDGRADLAIGTPRGNAPRDDARVFDTGTVVVLEGASGGLTTAHARLWHQDVPGVPNATEPDDGFGAALTTGDFDGNRRPDLAVGVPSEAVTVTSTATLGAVNVLHAGTGGLGTGGAQFWHQDVVGVPGFGRNGFGSALDG